MPRMIFPPLRSTARGNKKMFENIQHPGLGSCVIEIKIDCVSMSKA